MSQFLDIVTIEVPAGSNMLLLSDGTNVAGYTMNSGALEVNTPGGFNVIGNATTEFRQRGLRHVFESGSNLTGGEISLLDDDDSHAFSWRCPPLTGAVALTVPNSLPPAGTMRVPFFDDQGNWTWTSLAGTVKNITGRGNSITGVEPTAVEFPAPQDGDQAVVFLDDGKEEHWAHNGTAWSLTFTVLPGSVPVASETVSGTVELATLIEVGLGIDPQRVVTVAGLRSQVAGFEATYGDGAATAFVIPHGRGDAQIQAQVRLTGTGEIVYPTIAIDGTNVTLTHGIAPANNEYTVRIQRVANA